MFKCIEWFKNKFTNEKIQIGLYEHIGGCKLSRYVLNFNDNKYEYVLINAHGRQKNKLKRTGDISHLLSQYSSNKDASPVESIFIIQHANKLMNPKCSTL